MRIVKLSVENIKKLKVVEITPSGNVVEVTGPNGSGKSSVLDAIFYALTRQDNVPTHVIRQGEDNAVIKLDLGELLVTRKFTAGGTTSLVVEAANGARFPSPQRMLDDLIGSLSFDPLAFTRLRPKEQLEALRKVVKLDVSAIDGARQRHFDERSVTHRRIKELETYLQAPPPPDGTPTEMVDVNALVARLNEAGKLNAHRESELKNVENLKDRIERNKAAAAHQVETIKRRNAEVDVQVKKIYDDLYAEKGRLQQEEIRLLKLVEADQKEIETAIVPNAVDTTELVAQVEQAQVTNQNVVKLQARLKIESDLKAQKEKAEGHSNAIAGYDKQRQEAIAAVQMPVEGMSFGDGEVLMNGLPLTNASSAEQLRVSVALAMAANPKLRVLRIKDGSLLDESNLRLLGEMAQAGDYQVWVERVEDAHGRPCVVMEDGVIRP